MLLRCWYMMAMMLIFCMDSYPSIIIEHWVKYGPVSWRGNPDGM
ncbi:hypothetical protein Hanom_Chr05g00402081 [Helianthus anomalus]